MIKIGLLKMCIVLSVLFTFVSSCKRNEFAYDTCTGVLNCRLQLPDNRIYECEVNQEEGTISNSLDSLLFGTVPDKMRLIYSGTIGSELKVNGTAVISGVTELDLTKPITLTSTYSDKTRSYQLLGEVEKVDHSLTAGTKVNGDIRMSGFNSSACTTGATYFKGKLYVVSAYYPNGTSATETAYYHLYCSSNGGASWGKVETDRKVIGGFGSQLVVLGDKMFVAGGIRIYGSDEDGNKPEPPLTWRMLSTTDGIHFTDCTIGQTGQPSARCFVEVVVHNGAIYLRRGKTYSFGRLQNVNQSIIFKTTDGTTWTSITPSTAVATNRTEDAFYSFNNKLWIQGGVAGPSLKTNLRDDLWSSADDGLTWVKETVTATTDVNMLRYGHKVVSFNGKAYMLFGETYLNDTQSPAGGIAYTTDGTTWNMLEQEFQFSIACQSRILPSVVSGEENLFYVIGGFAKGMGNYSIDGITMETFYDVWTKRIN